ncbi:MAG: methylenetetrahydrofolate reductase [Gammaproteobacteria bacterium]
MKSQQKYPQVFSFEFFPPKTPEGTEKLRRTRDTLANLKPRFFSVTFGAGGSTRERTFETVLEIQQTSGIESAPHREAGEFRYANELVDFIRAETGDYFHVEVAAYPEFHPQAPNAQKDLENFKRKVESGADSAITQYFYNPYAYFRFVDNCERMGLQVPIVPGIMPITNYAQLARFSDACGAEIPRWIRKRLEAMGDDRQAIRAFGEDVVTEICEVLLEQGAPGLHFYTLNQAAPAVAIWKNLGLDTPTALDG